MNVLRTWSLVLLATAGLPAMAGAAVRPADPSSFPGVFASAQGGDVIELTSGDYGSFRGGAKPSTVTIRPAAGADARMALDFASASNIRMEGLTVQGADLGGSTNNVTIAGSRFTTTATVDASSMSNANVVFDRDTFDGINACGTCYEGRLTVRGNSNPGPVGVAVTNSHFGSGGCSDGVQIVGDANGVQIGPGNEFAGIVQGSCSAHADSIQLYGSKNTKIVGNYFHDNDTIVMAPDGGDHETIADNVMTGSDYRPAVQLGTHTGTVFVHNTTKNIDVTMDHKSGEPASRDGVVRDNIFVNGATNALDPGNCSGCAVDHNLYTSSADASGTSSQVARPVFVGGANPTSYASYELAPSSPGKANASDGADRGVRFVAPAAAPAPAAPAGPAAAANRHGPRVTLAVARSASWASLRRGLRAKVRTRTRVRVTFLLSRKSGKVRSLVRATRRKPSGTRRYRLRPSRARLGRRRAQTVTLRVTATTAGGARTTLTRTIRIRR